MEGSEYIPPDVVSHFHNTPRYGYPNDIGSIFLGSLSAFKYASGLFFVPAMICVIFFIWSMLLIVFKCCCKGKVIGGAHLMNVPNTKMKCRTYRMCLCFVTTAIIFFCSITLSMQTVTLGLVFDRARSFILEFQYIVKQVHDDAETAIEAQDEFERSRIIALAYIQDGICQDESIETEFDEIINSIIKILIGLGDWSYVLDAALFEIEDILNQTSISLSEEMSEVIDHAENYTNVSWVMIIMLASSSMLMLGQLLAWFGPDIKLYFSIQTWVILPFFMISLSASVFMACFCAIVLVFNSDVCIGNDLGNPEGLLKAMVEYDGLNASYQNLFDHYILNACLGDAILINNIETIFDDTVIYQDKIQSSLAFFTPDVQETIEYLCSNNVSLDPTFESLFNVLTTTTTLIPKTQSALDSAYCPTVNKIYRNISHDIICTKIPRIFGSMFWLVLCYVCFGMILFTFRGVLFPSSDKKEERQYEEWEYDTREVMPNNHMYLGNSNVDFANGNKWSVVVGLKDSISGVAASFLNRMERRSLVRNSLVRRRYVEDFDDKESKEEFLPPSGFVRLLRDSVAGMNVMFFNRTNDRQSLGRRSDVSSLGGDSFVRSGSIKKCDDEESIEELHHPIDVFKKLPSVTQDNDGADIHLNIHGNKYEEEYDEYDEKSDNRSYNNSHSSHSCDDDQNDDSKSRSYSSDSSRDCSYSASRDSFHDNLNQAETYRITLT